MPISALGMLSATVQGPCGLQDLNQTALSHAKYAPATRSTCDCVLTAYATDVPAMSVNLGSPSYFTVSVALLRCTAVVCGISRSRSASWASTVSATELRTPPIGDSAGMS